jgi:hypothetical protein
MSGILIPALVTGLLLPLAATLVSLPQRIANWKIREAHLQVELTRIEHARDRKLAQLGTDERDQRQAITGLGAHAVIVGSEDEQELADIAERANAARDLGRQEAEYARDEIQRELDAGWMTHMFALQCQSGRQPTLRDVLPPKQQ